MLESRGLTLSISNIEFSQDRHKNSLPSEESKVFKKCTSISCFCFHNWLSILCIESKMQKISAYKYYNVLCFMRFCNLIFLVILGFQPSVKLGIIEIKKSKMSWFDNKLRPTFRSILLIHYAKCVFYCLFNQYFLKRLICNTKK